MSDNELEHWSEEELLKLSESYDRPILAGLARKELERRNRKEESCPSTSNTRR